MARVGSFEMEMNTLNLNEQWCSIIEFPSLASPTFRVSSRVLELAGLNMSQMDPMTYLALTSSAVLLATLEYMHMLTLTLL